MKLTTNTDFFRRHLFVTVLLAGMGAWFAYDGLVTYPKTPAADLYRSIEKHDAPVGYDLEAFKRQKTQTQYGFAVLALLGAATVGLHLLSVVRFVFSFDDDGFATARKRYAWSEITSVDRSQWEKKTILRLTLADGARVTLDAWHHVGVKDFAARLA